MVIIKTTLATAVKLKGVTKILATPYTGEGALGATAYQLDNIIADTTSLTQDDPNTTSIDCETRDEPIDTVTNLGSYQFTTTSADVQKEFLTNFLGFTEDSSTKIIYAPASYQDLYAEIRLVFGSNGTLVIPKVKLNSKIEATTLKTGLVKATIAGTAFSVEITTSAGTTMSPFYMVPSNGTDSGAPTES